MMSKPLAPSLSAKARIASGPFVPGKRGVKPLVRWIAYGDGFDLEVGRGKHPRCVATVWANGTWCTWNRSGSGGENDREETVKQAKVEAAASAIAQGFI
jgi:hypothetical protein